MSDIGHEILNIIEAHAHAIGVDLKDDLREASEFAAERAEHLARIIGEPGYQEALLAERDAIALRLTSDTIEQADAVDQRFLAFVGDALTLSARLLIAAI